MSVRILFIGVVIFLVAFALPVSACDVESSKQNASVDTLMPNVSAIERHVGQLAYNPLSVKDGQKHGSHKDGSDCCEDGCFRTMANCNHVSTLACFSHSHLALNYAEQYDFISLAVPVGIYSPPYRPPIA